MNIRTNPIQKILLVIFVLVISFGIGWYGQIAIKNFRANFNANKVQNL